MLSSKLLLDPNALFEIWRALNSDTPLIPVAVTGMGYDFSTATTDLADMRASLEKARPGNAKILEQRLPRDTSVESLGRLLQANLTSIIAIPWTIGKGENHMQAVLDDILHRLPRSHRRRMSRRSSHASLRKSGAAPRKSHPALTSSRSAANVSVGTCPIEGERGTSERSVGD